MAYYMENTREEETPRVEVKRGEVWYLKAEGYYGHEQSMGRPILIISSDFGNESACPTVLGAFLSTSMKFRSVNVKINSVPRQSMVMCNQIVTVDRMRLSHKIGTLSEKELELVDKTLARSLGLNLQTPEKDKDLVQIECDLYKRLYTKALEKLTEIQFAQNLNAMPSSVKEEEPEPEPVVEEIEEPKRKRAYTPVEKPEFLDINGASFREIMSYGFSPTVAAAIRKLRPYERVTDLLLVPGVTTTKFNEIREHLVCEQENSEDSPEKVNLNSATYEELRAIGFADRTAKEIIRYRNKHGSFNSVGELLNVNRLGSILYDRMKDKVEV